MLRYNTYDAGQSVRHGEDILHINLYRNDTDALSVSWMEFFAEAPKIEFLSFIEAANDALDEVEALVNYNEQNNLYATKTYRNMVDILIRAGRR